MTCTLANHAAITRTSRESSDPERGPSLVILGDDAATRFPLPPVGEIVIGRGETAGLRLPGARVSRCHARLTVDAEGVRIVDLGSRHGLFVNGARTTGATLQRNDAITIGDVVLVLHVPRHRPLRLVESEPQEIAPLELELPGGKIRVADPAMRRIYAFLERLAGVDLTVLIGGETGTGKELAAQALHHWSRRSARPFVALNCAALPEGLVESELFGAEKGAFSGAATTKLGLLEAASGGTLFLDEIGDLSLASQAKLLRVLETRRVKRLGDVKEREIDLRVIAASHHDLQADVAQGRFREDLYFRLSGAHVVIPPLRSRPADVPLLAQLLLERARAAAHRPDLVYAPAALAALAAHDWPGNVRELKHAVELAVATARDGVISPRDLPARRQGALAAAPVPASPGPGSAPCPTAAVAPGLGPIGEEIRRVEKAHILAALEICQGNQTRAAKLIEMPRRTFLEKLKLYGLFHIRSYRAAGE